jgi:hypothetical protein
MRPDLVPRPADPEADAFLERLALWALRFTPLAAADAPEMAAQSQTRALPMP